MKTTFADDNKPCYIRCFFQGRCTTRYNGNFKEEEEAEEEE